MKMLSLRIAYLTLFFTNAIFAALFKNVGEDALQRFGTFKECDKATNPSCSGNQIIFRASFSIAVFFLLRTILSQLCRTTASRMVILTLIFIEIPVYLAMLVGSFFIPSDFFDGYKEFARVASGLFILFQILSIVDFSYQIRDSLLNRIASAAETGRQESGCRSCAAVFIWKFAFLGFCCVALTGIGAGLAVLYEFYSLCSTGIAFTTITAVFAGSVILVCVSTWLDVGLLPPCVVSGYLVLMCWQALMSNPDKSCTDLEQFGGDETRNSMVYSAFIGAFAITWTSWRTSQATSDMFTQQATASMPPQVSEKQFADVAAANDVEAQKAPPQNALHDETAASPARQEPWQFYCMMTLAGIYMAMVLTDWDSSAATNNGVSMWVQIVAQWLTMLLFLWTLLAPKLFPDRDFS